VGFAVVDIKKTLERLYVVFLLIGTSDDREVVIEIYLKDGSVRYFGFQGEKKRRDLQLIKNDCSSLSIRER
jgi:5-methylcytosine-specific restriction endonuclease McrBC GTP-binding regulatory subunit McrB